MYEIEDSYIIDNFIVQGEDISVSYENGKIVVEFLHELENYTLRFVPKNECKDVNVWSTLNMELLERGNVCEQEYLVDVQLENKKQEEIENTDKEDKEDKTEENEEIKQPEVESSKDQENELLPIPIDDNEFSMLEVNVPNTKQNRPFLFEILCLLGSCYFVFKK